MKTRRHLLRMLAVIIVPVACLSAVALSMLLRFEREARLRGIQEMAHSTSLRIDSEVARAEAAARVIANSREIQVDDLAGVYRLASAVRTSPLSWTLVTDHDGNGLLNTFVPFGTPLAKHTGRWAADVYDAQRPRVSGYFYGASAKRGVVSVDVPVPASAGRKYVVTQIFDPEYFAAALRDRSLQPGWIVGVHDAKGLTIARNAGARVFVGTPVRPELYAASRQAETGVLRHPTREGIEVYDLFVRSPLTGWTVAIGVPVAEIEAAAKQTTLYAALALLLVLTGSVAAAIYYARRIELERLLLLDQERAARLRAESQDRAKDSFIAMLGHELRNPLAALTSATTLLRFPNVPADKAERAWDIAGRQLKHLTHMVDHLLDVRRLLTGKVELKKAPVNVGELLQFCCDSQMLADRKAHAWSVQASDAWTVGDRDRLTQIIDNLLENAAKFTPEGGGITVRNYVADEWIVIEVSDTGAGIPAEVIPEVFESLVQGPTSIDRRHGGLGLGLAIAKGLTELHGGRIGARSGGAGAGSTFTVQLPLSVAPVASSEHA